MVFHKHTYPYIWAYMYFYKQYCVWEKSLLELGYRCLKKVHMFVQVHMVKDIHYFEHIFLILYSVHTLQLYVLPCEWQVSVDRCYCVRWQPLLVSQPLNPWNNLPFTLKYIHAKLHLITFLVKKKKSMGNKMLWDKNN